MKRILLVSNYVFHYRQKVYNDFVHRFARDGYELHVLSDKFQEAGYDFRFQAYTRPMTIRGYIAAMQEIQPDVVILFLHLKDKVQIPLMRYCNAHRIPVIFWNKGLSDQDPHNPIKNFFYHYIHRHCDALITYTPEMVSNFRKGDRHKLFVAYNTVDCTDIDKTKYDKAALRRKYGIREHRVVLYVSRLKANKRIEVLLRALANQPDVAVVAMGGGMSEELQTQFDAAPNLYYLGQRYGTEGQEIWAMGDVFSIPVNVGLGINEAIFWGMPVVTMAGFQPPEIYYLKEGKTGFVAPDEEAYRRTLLGLLADGERLETMRRACLEEYDREVDIRHMYQGFIDAVRYCRKGNIKRKTEASLPEEAVHEEVMKDRINIIAVSGSKKQINLHIEKNLALFATLGVDSTHMNNQDLLHRNLSAYDGIYLNWFENIDGGRAWMPFLRYLRRRVQMRRIRRAGLKVIFSKHNRFPHDARYPALSRDLYRRICDMADVIVAFQEEAVGELKEIFPERSYTQKVEIIPPINYVGAYLPNPKSRFYERMVPYQGKLVMGFMGALLPYKNVELILRTAKELAGKPVVFLIAGKASDRAYGEKLCTMAQELDNVIFSPERIPDEDMAPILDISDVLILPYDKTSAANSGVGRLAFSYGKTVISPAIASMKPIPDAWMYKYDYHTTQEHFPQLLEQVRRVLHDWESDPDSLRQKGALLQKLMERDYSQDAIRNCYGAMFHRLFGAAQVERIKE